jgi:hypothetical protein
MKTTFNIGWKHKVWEKTLLGKNNSPIKHRRNYLINEQSGAIISANRKSWCDAVIMIMWSELLLFPQLNNAPALLIVDNFSAHTTPPVIQSLEEGSVKLVTLPPNCTQFLQPLDLNFNFKLKASIRSGRINQILFYIKDWKSNCSLADRLKQDRPNLIIPKPSVASLLNMILQNMSTQFSSSDYRLSMNRVFVKTGLAPQADGKFSPIPKANGKETEIETPKPTKSIPAIAFNFSELMVEIQDVEQSDSNNDNIDEDVDVEADEDVDEEVDGE